MKILAEQVFLGKERGHFSLAYSHLWGTCGPPVVCPLSIFLSLQKVASCLFAISPQFAFREPLSALYDNVLSFLLLYQG
jgi:hypothetical protein